MGEALDAGNVQKVSQLLQNDYNSKMEDKRKLEAALKNPTAPENRKIVEGKDSKPFGPIEIVIFDIFKLLKSSRKLTNHWSNVWKKIQKCLVKLSCSILIAKSMATM